MHVALIAASFGAHMNGSATVVGVAAEGCSDDSHNFILRFLEVGFYRICLFAKATWTKHWCMFTVYETCFQQHDSVTKGIPGVQFSYRKSQF